MSEVTLGMAYQHVLANLAREVLNQGVSPVAAQIRAKGDLSEQIPAFDRLHEPAKQSTSILAHANLVGAVRRHFAEKAQRKVVAQALIDVANSQMFLEDGTSQFLANVKLLSKGLAALKGTELEGLIPQGYIDQLKEQYRERAAKDASQVAARLVGEGTTGLIMVDNQNFLAALKALGDRVAENMIGERRGPGPLDALAHNLGDARDSLLAAFKKDGTVDAAALDAALRSTWAVLDAPEQKSRLSGLESSLLSAFCRCLLRMADFAAAYPGEPLVAPDVKAAQRAIMWSSYAGGLSLGDAML